ncbi:McrB family protein [Formosa algae]|uniref:DNA polymerase III delta prime subunit n=1 Tax=Formosa algae TaxID=225843 RepID=A0A9X0YNL3_9FLAO|nr:AAA family ATPase [Formosa algae]MBP1840522.1 DNA polymerase III delta prime subunit [Formosa algae]MDQ0336065.1 DNA polymerase III delta prime subunit [Formosa algae]OEI81051.1 restriction endonuclease [Formosa algae]
MKSIKLTPQRKEQLTQLWHNYRDRVDSHQIKYISEELDSIASDWSRYKIKIQDETFNIDDYTNRINTDEDQMPGGYLCNFLERTTKTVLGSSKPAGSALAFGVKLNLNGSYSIGIKRPNETKETAIEVFDEEIKPLFEKVTLCTEPSHKADLFENSKYPSKQILRKLSVLDHLNDFLFMYSDESIDALHDEIIDSETATNLGKNHEVRQVLNETFKMPNDPVESVLLSKFMWNYVNAKVIADADSPNVILYGPPGTGKTYAVTQSLDFACKGDGSRYEFVQFHPSFTYEDFIEGIKPKGVTKDGNIKFELTDGIFKKFCKRAKQNPDVDYYFVIDEINRANLSSVFGETLLCLEKDYRHDVKTSDRIGLYKTQYSALIEDMIKDGAPEDLAYHYEDGNAYFGVPKNVFFIGMMNDVDKSIDAFDLALRRRFKWIRKDCNYDVIEQNTRFRNGDEFTNIEEYVKCCNTLNDYISKELNLGKSYEFGHSFFMKMGSISKLKQISSKNLDELFNLHLRPTLKEYLRALYSESDLESKLDLALIKFKSPLKRNK